MALPDGLLEDTKNYLDITWEDADLDKKLKGILARGISYISNIAGPNVDFNEEGPAKELLLDYALYGRSNAIAEFEPNYRHKLLALQISEEVKAYEAENADI